MTVIAYLVVVAYTAQYIALASVTASQVTCLL